MKLWPLFKKNVRKFLPAILAAAWFTAVFAGLMGASFVQILFVSAFIFLAGFAFSFLFAVLDQWKRRN